MKPFVLFVAIAAIGMSSCISTRNSNRKENESVYVRIDQQEEVLALARLEPQAERSRGAIAAFVLGKGISLAADGIKKLIDADREKFTASYDANLRELYFYNGVSGQGALDPTGMQFNGFSVMRELAESKKSPRDTAVYMAFEVDKSNPYELLNNSVFRLQLKDFKLKYAKAKVPDARWYLPWTLQYRNKKTVQMDIEVLIHATWFGETGAFYDNIQIGKFLLTLRDVPLDPVAQRQYVQGQLNTRMNGYSLLVPRSYGFLTTGDGSLTTCYGQGLYNIDVNIKEAGKETFVTKMFYEHSDQIVDQLKKIKK